jgi:Rrf2 family protein
MKLSKRCEYGVKAAVKLSLSRTGGFVQSREIADSEMLPAKFLESILLALRSASILESKVGAGGGYRLARRAEDIRVTDVIAALERTDPEALNGNGAVHDAAERPGQTAIEILNERIAQGLGQAFNDLSLADLGALIEDRSGSLARSA